jgi:pilus assembly protein CpaF
MLRAGVVVIARCLGDDIGPSKPWLRARLPNGSRVAAMFPPASGNGITLTIRKFPRSYTAEDLVAMESLPPLVYELLKETIAKRKNVLFSGGTTSGKTTMMGAAVNMIPAIERIVCIENPMELKLTQPHVVRWEVKSPTKSTPGISAEKLVQEALRHRPDRIVFGEVLGEEAFDLLQAMNSGHSGTFSTLHADSPDGALSRLAELAYPRFGDPRLARREVARAIRYVIQVGRDRETGKRTVAEVIRVDGYDIPTREALLPCVFIEDFAADHALTFVGEARLGALRMLCEMGLKAIDIKPATPMAANVKEEPAT